MAKQTKKQLDPCLAGGAAKLERNGLLVMARGAQINWIENMRTVCYDVQKLRHMSSEYAARALSQCAGALGRGENPHVVVSSLGITTCMLGLEAGAGRTDGLGRLDAVLDKQARGDDRLGAFYQKCKTAAPGELPFSSETAAMAEIAMNLEYYRQSREVLGDQAARMELEQLFLARRGELFQAFEKDKVDQEGLLKANQSIVVNMVLSCPGTYGYMFNYVWDDLRVDLSQAEQVFAQGPDGARSVWLPPVGGLSYLKSGGHFVYRFGYRPVYTPNMYDDMIYEETREHYGHILEANRTGDRAYLGSDDYKASQQRVRRMRKMMRADGYDDSQISGIMRAASNRCEMYYITETENGRKEWAEGHPEEAAVLDTEKVRREEGLAAKREHNAAVSQDRKAIEWLSCPAEDEYEPELMRQAGSKLAPGMKLKDTFTEQDYVQLASIMAEFAESMDPVGDAYNLEKWYVPLKADPAACMERFVKSYFRMRMDPWQRRRYDLVNLARKTAEPLIDKESKLVASRSVGDIVSVGDTGGVVRGNSHVGAGCWVDSRSGVTDSEISGGVLVMMQSNIRNSALDGAGLVVNTLTDNTVVKGPMDPKEMRKDRDMGGSAARTLVLENLSLDYLRSLPPEEREKVLENMKRQAMLRASLYKDKTVEDYLLFLKERENGGAGLVKLTPEELRRREEERRQRHAEQSRLMNDKGQDYAATRELTAQLRARGVPAQAVARVNKWGVEAAQVDSIDVDVEAGRIAARHDRITSAMEAAERSEEKAAAKAAQASLDDDMSFPGSKWL